MINTIRQEMAQKFIEQMMEIFIEPEMQRRQSVGLISKGFVLNGVQIIFYPDGRQPAVRLNDEVRAIANIKLKEGIAKRAQEPIYRHEIEEYGHMALVDSSDADCGHATIVRINEASWTLSFDFVYNKAMSKAHLERAESFLKSAELNLQNENWPPLVDHLFDACELIARAILLGMPDPKFRENATHDGIQFKFNQFARFGNVRGDDTKALNKLSGMATSARYMKGGVLNISRQEANEFIATIREMKRDAENRIAR